MIFLKIAHKDSTFYLSSQIESELSEISGFHKSPANNNKPLIEYSNVAYKGRQGFVLLIDGEKL